MMILPARWSIDRWPMRAIVSFYLLASGALLSVTVVVVGLMLHAVQTVALSATQQVFTAMSLTPQAQPHPAMAAFYAAAVAVAVFFLAAVALMWTPWRLNWAPALVAGLAAAGAWWFLAYANVSPPNHPTPLAVGGLFLLTAIVTLGVLAAIVRRAPRAGSEAEPRLVASSEDGRA